MTGKETLSIGLITSGGDETEQYVNFLQQNQVAVSIRLQPSEIAAEHIANNALHVWLLDIDENDWTDQLDDLLDQSQVPVFFHERGSLSSQSHPEFWIQKQLERLYDMAGIELPQQESVKENIDSVELIDEPISDETEDSVARLEQVTEELSSALKNLATDGSESSNVIDEVVDDVEQVAQDLESNSVDWDEADFDLDSPLEEPESEIEDTTFSKQEGETVDDQVDSFDDSTESLLEPTEFEAETLEPKLDEQKDLLEPDLSSELNLESEPSSTGLQSNETHEESLTADHLDNELDDFAADLDAFLEQKDSSQTASNEHSEPLLQQSNSTESEIAASEPEDRVPSKSDDIYDKPMGFEDELDDWTLDNTSLEEDSLESENNESLLAEETETATDTDWSLDAADDENNTPASELALEQEKSDRTPDSMELSLEPLQEPSMDLESVPEHEYSDNHEPQELQNDLSVDSLPHEESHAAADASHNEEDIGSWDFDLDDANLELDLSMPEPEETEHQKTEPTLSDNFPEESLVNDLQSEDDGLDFSLEEDSSSLELQNVDDEFTGDGDETDVSFEPSDDRSAEEEAQLELSTQADDSEEIESMDIPLLDDAAVGMQFDELDEAEQEIELPELNLWVLGASLGGPAAVKRFLQALPRDLDTAFVLAQHIDDNFLPVLCEILDTQTPFKSIIIDQPMPLKTGCVYIAPIKHKIAFTSNGMVDVVHEPWTPPYSPCIDDVIVSAAEVYRSQCGVIIFSGMGNDGTQGLEQVNSFGLKVWAQSPDSCANSSMPESAIEKQLVEFIGHPEQLARQLQEQLESAVSV